MLFWGCAYTSMADAPQGLSAASSEIHARGQAVSESGHGLCGQGLGLMP